MKISITLAPPNSLILVMDYVHGKLPSSILGRLVSYTESCIAVGTISGLDGTATITLADSSEALSGPEILVFDGILETPGLEVSICSVENKKLITMPVVSGKSLVRVFVNDEVEPDQILVLVHKD